MGAVKSDRFYLLASALSGLIFAASGALTRAGKGFASSFLVIFVHGIICSAIFLAFGFFRPAAKLSKLDRKNLIVRTIFAAVGIGCLTINYSLSPLPFAFAIANSGPFFFALVETFNFRKAKSFKFLLGFCLIGLGTLVMCVTASDSAGFFGISVGVVGALFSGLSFRKLSVVAGSIEWHVIGFYLGTGLVFLGVLGVSLSPWRVSGLRIHLIAMSGVLLFFAQALMTIGFKKLSGVLASVLSFSSIAWASLLQTQTINAFQGVTNILCYICMAVGAALIAMEDRRRTVCEN
ncbi:MAG: hypothetical protein JST04_08285 [Bdellovibrionales bacterium]|nr:hypothetical protein [Bdellovibrionales bacterium]